MTKKSNDKNKPFPLRIALLSLVLSGFLASSCTVKLIGGAGINLGSSTSSSSGNTTPTNISLTSASIDENQAAATLIGTLSSTDSDAADTHSYTFVTGTGDTDNASFSISGSNLTTLASFDFETKSSYSIRIRTTDSGAGIHEKVFTITVNNLNDVSATVSDQSSALTQPSVDSVVTFTIGDVDSVLECSSTYLSMTSSDTALVQSSSVVWGTDTAWDETTAICTATISPEGAQTGTTTITFTVDDGPNPTAQDALLQFVYGDGFGAGADITVDIHGTFSVALGDLDGDGNLDLVAGNGGGTNRRFLGDGAGGFDAGADITADVHWTLSLAL